jgi:hypothetical protein
MVAVPFEMPAWLGDAVERQSEGFRRAKFLYESWEREVGALPGIDLNLRALDGAIGREEMVVLVDAAMSTGRTADAFVLTMVWGHGPSGYGAARTRRILTSDAGPETVSLEVLKNLEQAAELTVADDDGYSSFFHLNNRGAGACVGLGPSFFTKWLYAASARGEALSPRALPILDEVVRSGLRGAFVPDLRRGKSNDFATFVRATRSWAQELSTAANAVSAASVEEAIFDHVRGYAGAPRLPARALADVLNR